MIKQTDMWHILTRSEDDAILERDDYTWRLQSVDKEYLNIRGNEWKKLGFINDFKVVQNST